MQLEMIYGADDLALLSKVHLIGGIEINIRYNTRMQSSMFSSDMRTPPLDKPPLVLVSIRRAIYIQNDRTFCIIHTTIYLETLIYFFCYKQLHFESSAKVA